MSSLENKSYLATKNTNSHNCAIVQTTTEMIRNSTDSQIKIDNNTKEDKMMLNIIINTIDEIDYYDDDEEIDENKDEIKNQMDAGQMKLSLLLSGMELDDIYSYLSFFLISMMSTIRVRKPTARRGVART
ncbi:unnamed protein product, partial [Rotaria socialis]